jgi:hypothetical protein
LTDFVELNPGQAYLLLRARKAEHDRKRHQAETWVGQMNRDIKQRDECIAKAIASGVPSVQANRFIYWKGEE